MSRFTAGLIAIVVIAVASFVGFTKFNPFASPYQLEAVFRRREQPQPELPGADRGRGGGQGQVDRAKRERHGHREDGDQGRGPADPRGRHAQGAAADLPRGQLLRGHPAGVALRAGARGGRADRAQANRRAGPVRRPAGRAPERHARRPPGLPQGVLEGSGGQGRRGASTSSSEVAAGRSATSPSPARPRSARSPPRTYSGC